MHLSLQQQIASASGGGALDVPALLTAVDAHYAAMDCERRQAECAHNDYIAQLVRSNAELERFAYIASHDLQEPLRTISSFVGLLQQRHAGKLEGEAREFMGFIAEGSARMSELIRSLLHLSRLQGATLHRAPVDLGQLLAASLEELQAAIAECGAEIRVAALPTLNADAAQVRRLLTNLISNALKFRHPTRRPLVQVHARREGQDWQMSVSDNGIGIALENRQKVFQIFQRLHTHDEYPGSGIGLALCERIVHNHGGRIGVAAAEGGGSEFWFTLPA